MHVKEIFFTLFLKYSRAQHVFLLLLFLLLLLLAIRVVVCVFFERRRRGRGRPPSGEAGASGGASDERGLCVLFF